MPETSIPRPRREQYALWARLLDSILPAPDENRLVTVAEVGRSAVPMVEDCLADAGISPIVSEIRSPLGDERFRVLVPAREARIAGEVVAGL